MKITFEPLAESHFPLLLTWLTTPHVKAWWDKDIHWTADLIQEKYSSYVKGFKLQDGVPKEIYAYIICVDTAPTGYIQLYNAYDFPRSTPLIDLPEKLATLDIFIGEIVYLGQNIGSQSIILFLKQYCDNRYTHIFLDLDVNNIAAIKAYTKAGFKTVKTLDLMDEIWMLKEVNNEY